MVPLRIHRMASIRLRTLPSLQQIQISALKVIIYIYSARSEHMFHSSISELIFTYWHCCSFLVTLLWKNSTFTHNLLFRWQMRDECVRNGTEIYVDPNASSRRIYLWSDRNDHVTYIMHVLAICVLLSMCLWETPEIYLVRSCTHHFQNKIYV